MYIIGFTGLAEKDEEGIPFVSNAIYCDTKVDMLCAAYDLCLIIEKGNRESDDDGQTCFKFGLMTMIWEIIENAIDPFTTIELGSKDDLQGRLIFGKTSTFEKENITVIEWENYGK